MLNCTMDSVHLQFSWNYEFWNDVQGPNNKYECHDIILAESKISCVSWWRISCYHLTANRHFIMISLMTYHILSKVPVRSDDVDKSKGDGKQTEEDIRDRQVCNENISRCHHLLKSLVIGTWITAYWLLILVKWLLVLSY